MIFEILAVGLIISAILALFLDEVVYSVAALAGTFFFVAFIYVLNGALYAAIFQFAVGIGTLAILFLSGEMLGDKPAKKTSAKRTGALVGIGVGFVVTCNFPFCFWFNYNLSRHIRRGCLVECEGFGCCFAGYSYSYGGAWNSHCLT